MVGVVVMQRNIDAGYDKKRVEVEKSIAAQKAKDEAVAKAVAENKAAYPEAFGALKKIFKSAEVGAVDPSEVQALLEAVNTKPVKPVNIEEVLKSSEPKSAVMEIEAVPVGKGKV